jgi:hypothetical protein
MTTPTMAQPTAIQANGTSESPSLNKAQPVAPGKRKRETEEMEDRDEDNASEEQKPAITNGEPKKDQRDVIKSFVEVLSRYACFFLPLLFPSHRNFVANDFSLKSTNPSPIATTSVPPSSSAPCQNPLMMSKMNTEPSAKSRPI